MPTPEQLRATVDAYVAAYAANDREALLALFAPDTEWTDPVGATTDSFPSGNGVPGGDFKFGVNVLAGDVNGHGKVDGADLLQVRRRMSIVKPAPGLYNIFFDVNGDGVINATDLAWVRRQQQQSLPAVQ